MITQDSLSLLLTKLRNGFMYRTHCVVHQNTKMSYSVVHLLYMHGYLRGFRVCNNMLYIYPKFTDIDSVIRSIQRVSRPGFKKYITVAALKNFEFNQSSFIVVSTTSGLMSHHAAIKKNLGGEFLFLIS
jgi:ribosomal protein S8